MRPMMPIEPMQRNTWADGLTVVQKGMPDEAFFAHYYKPSNGEIHHQSSPQLAFPGFPGLFSEMRDWFSTSSSVSG